LSFLFGRIVPQRARPQKIAHPRNRFTSTRSFDLGAVAVAAGIIGCGVIAQAICQGFNECGAAAAPSTFDRFAHHFAHDQNIVAVDLNGRYVCSDCFLCQCPGRCLCADGHGDRPTVVDDHAHQRQRLDAGKIDSFVKGALRSSTVTNAGNGAASLASDLHRKGSTGCMWHL
jgi:hypothetical protein